MKRRLGLYLMVTVVVIFLLSGTCFHPRGPSREMARRAVCGSRLESVYTALQEYRTKHNGDYPGSLDDLCPDYLLSRDPLKCVSAKRKFLYLGAEGPLNDDAILAYDHPENHDKDYGDSVRPCVIVLLNNGQVVEMPLKDFRAKLRQQLSANPPEAAQADAMPQ